MIRRGFLAGVVTMASGLVVPEPVRRYFFAPSGGWTVLEQAEPGEALHPPGFLPLLWGRLEMKVNGVWQVCFTAGEPVHFSAKESG